MNDDDLDDSLVVEFLAQGMQLAWMALLVGVILWFGFPPLVAIQDRIGGTPGSLTAVASGVAFLVGSRALYDWLRARQDPPGS